MSEIRILRLAPGCLRTAPAQIRVRWEHDGDPRTGTLPQALDALAGQSVALVLPVSDVLLTRVSVTRKQARHLHKILPYLLEERLAVEPESQWYAAGKPVQGRYPVIVAPAEPVRVLRDWLLEQGVDVAGAAVDAQLLADLAPALVSDDEQLLLIDPEQEPLCVPRAERDAYLAALGRDANDFDEVSGDQLATHFAQRWASRVELFQGELRIEKQRPRRLDAVPVAWRQAAAVVLVMVLAAWALAWLQAWQYHRLATEIREQNAALYQQLFPGDRATARLTQQFRSRLAQLGGGGATDQFVALMGPVGAALAAQRGDGMTPKRLLYEQRDGTLLLDVEAGNYEQLESLKGLISEKGFDVELANFRNQGERVAARIKVAPL